jgi:transcriptional regulator with XRE-family HTH domain
MRGAGDQLSVGERIAFYRRRRGLSQAVLADLVRRTEDWLSKIERGERDIRRLDVLADVARGLRVTLGDLLGEPVLMEDTEEHDDVPAIRDALMAPRRLSRTLFSSSLSPEYIDPGPVTQLTEGAWSAYQRGDLGRVVTALPGLIKTTQQMEAASADDAAYRRACAAVSARIHHLAATTLSKIGEADLAWIAAERAMQAADEADDPLVLASAARSGTHALLAVGRFDDALELGEVAARWLGPRMAAGDPVALSLYGMLHLRTAVAAARHQDRSTTNDTGVVRIDYTVLRVKGKGLRRCPTKTAAGERTLPLPTWVLVLLRARRDKDPADDGPVFCDSLGGLRDPSNTMADLREARGTEGFAWVTSHVFRKTAATIMDEAGLTARVIADQLGHSKPSMTQDVYLGRKLVSPAAAEVLERAAVKPPSGFREG